MGGRPTFPVWFQRQVGVGRRWSVPGRSERAPKPDCQLQQMMGFFFFFFFRPESRRRELDTYPIQCCRGSSALLFRLILASPIDTHPHLHSSRCGVAVETVACAHQQQRPVFRREGRKGTVSVDHRRQGHGDRCRACLLPSCSLAPGPWHQKNDTTLDSTAYCLPRTTTTPDACGVS